LTSLDMQRSGTALAVITEHRRRAIAVGQHSRFHTWCEVLPPRLARASAPARDRQPSGG
jgi:hypothetical protein